MYTNLYPERLLLLNNMLFCLNLEKVILFPIEISGGFVENIAKMSKNIKFLVIFESLTLCVAFKGKPFIFICCF